MRACACVYNIWLFLIVAAVSLAALGAKGQTNAPSPVIVCTTTHLSGLVNALAGDLFQAETVVPWGMCPGHFELKRGDIEKIRGTVLILGHGTEKFLSAFEGNKAYAPIAAVSVSGNWMIPAVQKRAAKQVTTILAEKFPQNAEIIHANLLAYEKRIDVLENELQPHLKRMKNIPVVCSTMSAEYVAWMELIVSAEFQRDDDLSLRNLQDVIQKARKAGARIVVDNRQSSGKAGQTLARQLDLPLVMISNFPEPDSSGRISYEATLKKNVLALNNSR